VWSPFVPVLAKIKVTLLLTLQLDPEGKCLLSHGIVQSPCITARMRAFACPDLIAEDSRLWRRVG